MAGDCGLNALSLLPENMQVQYLQKNALRAENPFVPKMTIIGTIYIFCVSNFLLPLRQLIFRQKQPGHWGRGCLPFSPTRKGHTERVPSKEIISVSSVSSV